MSSIHKLEMIYNLELNAGISWFWDGGYDVWLGDEINGIKCRENFRLWSNLKNE